MKRIPQDLIEECLLSDEPTVQMLGRLFATNTWARFQDWFDGENINSADKSAQALGATIKFVCLMIDAAAERVTDHPTPNQAILRNIELNLAQLRRLK